MKNGILSFLLALSTLSALAQFPVGGFGGQRPQQPQAIPGTANDPTPRGNSKITGYIVDSSVTKAVEFASVALYNKATNKAVDGTVADEKGKFTLGKVAAGNYKLLITFIGFTTKTVDNLSVVKGQDIDLGVIKLAPNVKTLEEVTVTGQRALVEEKVDRLVYNAEKDLTSKGGDATDILRKVPLLSVDLDGNVQLRGNSNIRVLINNKPSTIIAQSIADALKQIPADQIKTVEVITSPSAKYDAEGSGGIINIITKKNTLQGLTLGLDTGVGNRGANLGLNGSYRKGKMGFNLSGFGRANYNVRTKLELDQSSFVNNNTVRTVQTADGLNQGAFGRYNLSWDYDIAKNQSLTANVAYGSRNQLNQQNFWIKQFLNGNPLTPSGRNVDTKDLSGTVDVNIDYTRTYKPQQEWSVSTQFSRNNRTNNFDADLLNGIGNPQGIIQQNINHSSNQEITLQTDYQTPIKKNQMLEFGGKGIFRKVLSDYRYQNVFSGSGDANPVPDPRRPAGSLDYDQNIAAGYLSYTLTTKNRYTIKAGARYEYTAINASTREKGPIAIPDYSNLVPSINISKTIKGKTYKLAYNRRIQRPGIQQLNPNVNLANPQNISFGNPALRPELTDNVEASLSTSFKKTYLNMSLFSRFTGNSIETVRLPSDTARGVIVNTFQNIGKQQAYGTNVFANVSITPKWSIGGGIDLFYSFLQGQVPTLNGLSQALSNQGWNYGGRVYTNITFKNGWGAQGFGFMRGRQIQLQGFNSGFAFYSFGVKKDFKNKKGSFGIAAENFLFNRFHIRTEVSSPTLVQNNNTYLYNRGIRATFSYQIGKMSMDAPRRRNRGVNNDDVKSGGDDNNGGGQQAQPQQQTPAGGAPAGGRPGGGFRPGGGGGRQ
jgi:outer membrane receptor protein involved in Fe transport